MNESKKSDPDNLGWSYSIYRSDEAGTFITNVGSFQFHGNKRMAFFRNHGREKGFSIEFEAGEIIYMRPEIVSAMKAMLDSHGR